jgi:putative NADH-flavin reductase
MRLTIFAATGGIGREALGQATAAGYEVTAVVRDPRKIPGDVRSVKADLMAPDPATLETAVERADSVLSCLGPRSKAEVGITSQGTRAIVGAMQAAGPAAWSSSAPRRSGPCPRPTVPHLRSMTRATGSSCGI